jgi:hypothetical protein
MSKQSIYLETSFISYLTADPSRDIKILSMQQASLDWWHQVKNNFELFISDIVINEAKLGDLKQADKRLGAIRNIPVIELNEAAVGFADSLIKQEILPRKAFIDALHISYAAFAGVDYILTWNFKYLANAQTEKRVIKACSDFGIASPLICTPFQFLEE